MHDKVQQFVREVGWVEVEHTNPLNPFYLGQGFQKVSQ